MNDIIGTIWDVVLTAVPLAAFSLICVYISRPFLKTRLTRVASQTIASLLLLFAYGLSKSMSDEQAASYELIEIIKLFAAYFISKAIAIYFIACYAKSVGKSPYWGFVGLLNFILAMVFMGAKLWRSSAKRSDP